jgi:hypothetical protein
MLPSWDPAQHQPSFEISSDAGLVNERCNADMFLALAGLEAKANGGLGQTRQILPHVHRANGPWTRQPLNHSLETQETLQPSKAGCFYAETAG